MIGFSYKPSCVQSDLAPTCNVSSDFLPAPCVFVCSCRSCPIWWKERTALQAWERITLLSILWLEFSIDDSVQHCNYLITFPHAHLKKRYCIIHFGCFISPKVYGSTSNQTDLTWVDNVIICVVLWRNLLKYKNMYFIAFILINWH